MTARDLLDRLHRQPVQPFRVKLSDNSTIDVLDYPGTVVVGPTRAIMPLETVLTEHGHYLVTRWRTIELSNIVKFINIDPHKP